ncbi:hypothetical protein [Enterococcus caccae]|uniref:Uncharacterized protein n=1 Tax=Enterococcus caccae ATCC BAA-1240 TaxID=1158612 RepID=R3WVK3_9ENTE|nr:hypothetical protein [Enterococcus caccae]EOL45830.1 hypothetical protein UC7_01627 [Enterococcus caccae ATCC BAA-1240]EOT61026.1 hypothetical protein I580_01928 [Enterococcus caccae ATCC BAA-1240]OJG27944.1 hypothetical protein RU98_GL002153 [Enterococcus caccae]
MEIPLSKIGLILEQYQKLGYFESDSLHEAIKKMINDTDTTMGINVQTDENSENSSFEDLWTFIWENIK